MISSRITRRDFFGLSILLSSALTKEKSFTAPPKPQFQIGDRVVTARICDDRISSNFGCLEWECGFIIGYCWEWDEWLKPEFLSGWIYWIRFDESNNSIFDGQVWIDFAHESEIAIAKNPPKSLRSFVLNNDFRNILQT